MFDPQDLKKFIETYQDKKQAPVVQGIWDKTKNRSKHVLYNPLYPTTKEYEPYLKDFIHIMNKTMVAEHGIGIAANQIGIPLQIFLIEFDPEEEHARYNIDEKVAFQVFINPKITKASKEWVSFWHGCLSAKGKRMGQVASYQWIEYEALDAHLKPIKGKLSNMSAVIFQHEFRHLLGKTYVDQAKVFEERDDIHEKFDQEKLDPGPVECDHTVPHIIADYKLGNPIR